MAVATRFDNVQALRGIAALMVCVFHLAGHTDGALRLLPESDPVLRFSSYGPTGVFVFFVISGFIIPYSMYKSDYQLKGFFIFFKKRLWRLHPPYLLTLLLTIILISFNNAIGKANEDVSAIRVLSHLFYTTKIMNLEWFNPIFWTLAIEIQYYLLLALLFSWFNGEKMWQRGSFIVLLLASTYFLKDDRFITFYIGPFVLGFSVFYLMIKRLNLIECMVYAILASLNIYYFVGSHWFIASAFALFFILYVIKTPSILNELGEISYSLYLTHPLFGGLFIYLLLPYNSSSWSGYAILVGAIVFSIITSHLFYRLIERRSIEWSKIK
jgi:peptidoglycan/LPS O-acetylase OafA/YrhL